MSYEPLSFKVIPPSKPHTHTIIFLHGRGSTAAHFVHELQIATDRNNFTLIDHFPSIRWVLPQTALRPSARFPGVPVSQWFDTWNINNLAQREELQLQGIKESVASLRPMVKAEVELLDGRHDRVILAGISQGGATAAHVLLNLEVEGLRPRLGGLMTFCSRFPFPGRILSETRAVLGLEGVPSDDTVVRETPVLWQHCVDDPLVRIEYGRELREAFARFGAQVEWKEYPEGGHWIQSPDGIEDAVAWLKRVVGGGGAENGGGGGESRSCL
ncbi:hypothetical protein OQA88_5437 [Cercophora sp. LCS_1]